ncbi:MAG: homoserine dehydrogenase [Anaerolineae bacterium]
MKMSRFALIGIGNIGQQFLRILLQKQDMLHTRFGVQLSLVAAVDSAGAALNDNGLDISQVLRLKEAGDSVAAYPHYGKRGMTALEALVQSNAQLLIELSPTNLKHGEPGLSAITWALEHNMDVVTANKGPLVLAYQRLAALAAERKRQLLFSGAVAGGLPTVNIGRRDLVAAKILRVEGIFNTTTNYILVRMAESGLSFEQALAEAQRAGVAEADPSLDIDGWDAANKLIIVANSVLGMPATLQDVSVQGIRGLDRTQLLQAQERGYAVKLLATAELDGERYKLAVRPTELPLSHVLARLTKWQMGVVYTTDINGTITAIIEEEGTTATAGAVLRDTVNLLAMRGTP